MVGMWTAQRTSSNCITPGCLAGIICYGHGLMVTAGPIIANSFWKEEDHLLMGSCISLVPMAPIQLGVAPSSIGSRPLLRLLLVIFSKLLLTIRDFCVAFPVDAFAIFMKINFLIPMVML